MKPPIISHANVRYVPAYLGGAEADRLLAWLLDSISWQAEDVAMFGKVFRVPRQLAWCGDAGCCYRYSNRDHLASGWPPVLSPLKKRLAEELPKVPDFLLMNRYRDGQDTMGWHTDDEAMATDLIGIISLGASRRFLIRPEKGMQSAKLELAHGSLLVMNRHLPHCLPRTTRTVGERVSLSFRTLT